MMHVWIAQKLQWQFHMMQYGKDCLMLKKEELELDLKIVRAESARKNDLLNNKISSLQVGNERQNEIINRYQKAFEFSITNTNTIADTLSIFSAEEVKKNYPEVEIPK